MEFKELISKLNSSSLRKVSKELNIPLVRLYRFLDKLEKDGYIIKTKKGQLVNYSIIREDESVSKLMKNLLNLSVSSQKPKIDLRIHNLVAKAPIISGSENITPEKVIKLKNVERKYFKIENLASAEIINKTLIIYLPEIKADPNDLGLILTTYFRILNHIFIHLQSKYRLFCDISQLQIVRQHISYEGDIPKFPLTTIKTEKEAKSIAEYKEKAWVRLGEESLGKPEIETNDLDYASAFYQMPYVLFQLQKQFVPAIQELTKQIKLHLEVMNEMKETLKEIRRYFEKKSSKT
jgi:hypothetical protein